MELTNNNIIIILLIILIIVSIINIILKLIEPKIKLKKEEIRIANIPIIQKEYQVLGFDDIKSNGDMDTFIGNRIITVKDEKDVIKTFIINNQLYHLCKKWKNAWIITKEKNVINIKNLIISNQN